MAVKHPVIRQKVMHLVFRGTSWNILPKGTTYREAGPKTALDGRRFEIRIRRPCETDGSGTQGPARPPRAGPHTVYPTAWVLM
jgi:hypothetical protein